MQEQMQSEILAARVAEALSSATLADQYEARESRRYADRIAFALARVQELRAAAEARQSVFRDARLGVALTILEGHVIHAANFIDGIALRQRSELVRVNRRLSGVALDDVTPVVAVNGDRRAA